MSAPTYFQVLPDASQLPNLYVYTFGGQQMFDVYQYTAPPAPPPRGNQLLTTSLIVDLRGSDYEGGAGNAAPSPNRDRDSRGRKISWE